MLFISHLSFPLLSLTQWDVGLWPEVTEISNGEVDCESHFRRHHNERHVPTQRCHNKE
jgi:hypothetical protein